MYLWQIDLNGICFYGRSWHQFVDLVNRMSEFTQHTKLIIYVQNLAYEFQFMRKYFKWDRVFAREKRKPFEAETNNIIFKCSMVLSNYSLAKIAENLHKYRIKKLVGQLDYKLIRNSKTELSYDELEYAYNDIKIIEYYIREEIERNGDICHIPMTSTGYARRYTKEHCYPVNDKNEKRKYYDLIKNLRVDVDEYKTLKRAFQGGFTHCNAFYSGIILSNVFSIDFNSSYPAVMLSEKFPMSTGEKVFYSNRAEFLNDCKRYCMIFDIEFVNIESKDFREHIISSSKCWDSQNMLCDNGKVIRADYIITTLTNVDLEYLNQFYNWDNFNITNVYRYEKNYLPKPIIDTIIVLYNNKTLLKNVFGKEVEYAHSKALLNSLYGMCVTDIAPDNIIYNDEWEIELPNVETLLDKYNKKRERFLFYPWGVFVTAYARRNLFSGIYEFHNDYVYSDTDSIKGINYEDHKEYIEKYNNTIYQKLVKMCNYYNIDVNLIKPKGKILGVWDYEGTYDKFKSIGSKRYLSRTGDNYKLTVAGVNKNKACEYLTSFYNPFAKFNEDLVIPREYSGKNILTYVDESIEGIVIDYQGNEAEYKELSFIHMEEGEYSFNLADSYIKFLMGYREDIITYGGLE